jgi:hypothetical protein
MDSPADRKKWTERLIAAARRDGCRSDKEIAARLGVGPQTFSAWKMRGLPVEWLDLAARSFDTSIEELRTGIRAARFHHQLTEEQRVLLEGIDMLDATDKEKFLKPLLDEVARIKRYKEK